MTKRLFGWMVAIAIALTLTLTHTVNISIGNTPLASAAIATSSGPAMDTEQIAAQLDPAVVTVFNNQQAQSRQSTRGIFPNLPGGGSIGGNGGSRGSNGNGNGSGSGSSSAVVPAGLGSGVIFDKQG